jgi:uncharacterized protein (DUF3084 family)
MDLSTLQTVISLILGLGGFCSGIVLWYKGSVEKRYAAERDFGHIRNNLQQYAQSLEDLSEQIDEIRHALDNLGEHQRQSINTLQILGNNQVEMKASILAIQNRQEGIAARLDSTTSGWVRRDN